MGNSIRLDMKTESLPAAVKRHFFLCEPSFSLCSCAPWRDHILAVSRWPGGKGKEERKVLVLSEPWGCGHQRCLFSRNRRAERGGAAPWHPLPFGVRVALDS